MSAPDTAGAVHWLALGGTIQSVGHHPLDLDRYHLTGRGLEPEQVLAPVAELLGEVRPEAWRGVPSHELGTGELLALVARVRAVGREGGVRGVVVSCGSNGLEELAYLLWLLYPGPVPVVVTAAMRPATAVGADGPGNLASAVAVARAGAERAGPVTVVSDGAVLHPAEAYKNHTSRVDSFASSAPALGSAVPGSPVELRRAAAPSPVAGAEVPAALPRVEVLTSYLGADGSSVRAAVRAGSRGIVSAGMGAGFVPGAERQALAEAAASGVAVCRSRRTPAGRVAEGDDGLLVSDRLTPQKARLALAVGLALGADRGALQELLSAPR